jgi:hypothetical protein
MHAKQLIFYKVAIQSYCINVRAVQRQAGLEMMFKGNAAIATAMGPDEDLAKPVSDENRVLICLDCAINTPIALLLETSAEQPSEGSDTTSAGGD